MPTRSQKKLALLRDQIESQPDSPLLQFSYGCECARARDYQEAVQAFRRSIRLKPDYSAAYRELGKALTSLRRCRDAKRIFEEGIAIAQRTGDLQTVREIQVFLRRLQDQDVMEDG